MRVRDWNLGGPLEPEVLRLEEEGPLAVGRGFDEWNAPLIVLAGGKEFDRGRCQGRVGRLEMEWVCVKGRGSREVWRYSYGCAVETRAQAGRQAGNEARAINAG